MKKKVIERAVPGFFIGIAIGQIISVLISLMSGNGEFIICTDEFIAQIGNEALAAAVQTLLCGIMGSGFAAASVIWELENISIAAQSGICFGIYAVIMFPIAYVTNWMEHSLSGIISYVLIFAVCFVTIWVIQYFAWKNKIKAINSKLEK